MNVSHFYGDERAPDVLPGLAFDAWRLRILDEAAVAELPTAERLAYFACWALLAPTTHNTVPQRFELRADEGALALWIDRARVLPESDPDGRQAIVSLGCVAETAILAAASFGYATRVDLEPAAGSSVRPAPESSLVRVATLHFSPSGERVAGDWLGAIKQRKMVRAVFDDRVKLAADLVEDLQASVARMHPGLTLHLLTDAPTRLFLGKFQELADTTVINRPRFARELGDWLLPNDSPSTVGMRGHEFGLPDETAARMHRGLRGDERLLPDETAGFAKLGNLGMRTASAVAVIAAARDDLEHRLAAGRAYQQLALALSQRDLVTAMHAGITEVEAPNLALRGRLRTLQRPTVVFRIGAALHAEDAARPHASRPPLLELLVPVDRITASRPSSRA